MASGFPRPASDFTDVPPAFPGMQPNNKIVSREGQRFAADAGLFVEQRWILRDGALEIRPGLRVDYVELAGDPVREPKQSTQASIAAETDFFGLFQARATAYYQHQSQLPVDVISGATPISANGGEQSGGMFDVEGVAYTTDYRMRTYTTGLPILPSIGLICHAN